jgi:hypothetical protein
MITGKREKGKKDDFKFKAPNNPKTTKARITTLTATGYFIK